MKTSLDTDSKWAKAIALMIFCVALTGVFVGHMLSMHLGTIADWLWRLSFGIFVLLGISVGVWTAYRDIKRGEVQLFLTGFGRGVFRTPALVWAHVVIRSLLLGLLLLMAILSFLKSSLF